MDTLKLYSKKGLHTEFLKEVVNRQHNAKYVKRTNYNSAPAIIVNTNQILSQLEEHSKLEATKSNISYEESYRESNCYSEYQSDSDVCNQSLTESSTSDPFRNSCASTSDPISCKSSVDNVPSVAASEPIRTSFSTSVIVSNARRSAISNKQPVPGTRRPGKHPARNPVLRKLAPVKKVTAPVIQPPKFSMGISIMTEYIYEKPETIDEEIQCSPEITEESSQTEDEDALIRKTRQSIIMAGSEMANKEGSSPPGIDEVDEDDDSDQTFSSAKAEEILNEPITRAFLKAYLATRFQDESIVFWENVREVERYRDMLSKPRKIEHCQHIFDTFIKDGSDMEINIDSTQKRVIIDRIKAHPSHVSIFKEAKTEMEKLIISNNYSDFLRTDFSKRAKAVNDWFAIYIEFDDSIKKAIAEKVYQIRKTPFLSEYFPPPIEPINKHMTQQPKDVLRATFSFGNFGVARNDSASSLDSLTMSARTLPRSIFEK